MGVTALSPSYLHPMRWWTWLVIVVGLLIVAPLAARAGRGVGRRARGGFLMASVLLGFGQALDPPSKHLIEAREEEKAGPETGEPPLP
jgi:hypothetical protein